VELHNLYASPSVIGVIKSKRMRWPECVARMGHIRNAYKMLVGRREGKKHWEDICLHGRIILEWLLENNVGRRVLDSFGSE